MRLFRNGNWMLQCNVYQVRRQVFLRGGVGAIQRRHGPNVRQRREPLGEILKIRLSENALCAFWRQYDVKTGSQKQTLKCGYYSNRLEWIFLVQRQVYVCNLQSNLQRMSLFKKNKNRSKVESSHCLLGLRQQSMMISSAGLYILTRTGCQQ